MQISPIVNLRTLLPFLIGIKINHLLHGYDVIRILKLSIEERGEAEFFCTV